MVKHTKKEKMVDRDKYVFPFDDSELISRKILNFLLKKIYLTNG